MATRDDWMRRIQAMLDQADHPNTGEAEAEVFRQKANQLIIDHAFEAWELDQQRPKHMRRKPVLREIQIFDWKSVPSELHNSMRVLADALIVYNRCKLVQVFHREGASYRKVLGVEEDLDLIEMMFVRIRLHISQNLAPRVDPKLSWEENLVTLKEAGYKWQKIHTLLDAANLPGYPWQGVYWEPGTRNSKFTRFSAVYTDWCKARGQTRHNVHPEVWRRDFIRGYVNAVYDRILEMKRMNDTYKSTPGSGMGLALLDIEALVQEAYYEMFPDQRPHPKECQCDDCHYAKCNDEGCMRPRCVAWRRDRNKPLKYAREKSVAVSGAAYQSGKRVGATVDLSKASVKPSDRPIGPGN